MAKKLTGNAMVDSKIAAREAAKAPPAPIEPENFSEEIRKILVEARDPSLKASIVADRLSAKFPDSASVATKTASTSFSVYVSGQRSKAAGELGIDYEGGRKKGDSPVAAVVIGKSNLTLRDLADSEVEPEALAKAVELIRKAGGNVAEVSNLAEKWQKLIETVGIDKAKQVVDLV